LSTVPVGRAMQPDDFEAMFAGHPDGAFVLEPGAGLVSTNDHFRELVGYTDQELAMTTLSTLVVGEELRHAREEILATFQGEHRRFRTRIRTKFGLVRPVEVTSTPLRNSDHDVTAVLGILRDVGRLEEPGHHADRCEGIMRTAGRLAGLVGWSIDASGMVRTSDDMSDLVGADFAHSSRYPRRLAWLSDSDRRALQAGIEQAFATRTSLDLIVTRAGGADEVRHLRIVAEPVTGEGGLVSRLEGALYDVTGIVERERQRQRLQVLIETTLDQMASGIMFLDRDWRCTFINETGERYVQRSAAALIGNSLWEVFPDLWNSDFGTDYRRAMRDRVVTRTRGYYPSLLTWFEATAYPTEDGIVLHLHDVTEEHGQQLRLEESTNRLRAQAELLNAARDAIMVVGLDHRIQYWNRGAERMFGWFGDEAIGRSAAELLYTDPSSFDAAADLVLRAGHYTGETIQVTKDGSEIIVDCRWQLVRDQNGEPSSIFLVQSDITEYRSQEEKRYRDQRLESLGTLAGGIAHDLNNVLTPVLMAAQLLVLDEPDERRRELLRSIEQGANRGADMIRQVLTFARGDEGLRRPVSVRHLIRDLLDFATETVRKSTRVVADLDESLSWVYGDHTQLLQVLVNLVNNANDAMSDGGELRIQAYNTRGRAASPTDEGDAPHVIIDVRDEGCGMDNATLRQVFEPFFTTKPVGSGTGLGLSTSLAIVRSHGGTLDVESRPGAGSRFRLRLPAVPTPTDAAPRSHIAGGDVETALTGHGELILVVDDEPDVRMLVRRTLQATGYRAVLARNGAEALELLASTPAIAAVYLDVNMPVLDGVTAAQRIVAEHPTTPIVLASGLDTLGAQSLADRLTSVAFLAKPFTAAELLTAVASGVRMREVRA
jgi:two-component system cell cycle sensor histidine kinase/response regulator CckA